MLLPVTERDKGNFVGHFRKIYIFTLTNCQIFSSLVVVNNKTHAYVRVVGLLRNVPNLRNNLISMSRYD